MERLRWVVVTALVALVWAAPAALAAAPAGPPLSVPAAELAKSLDCPKRLAGASRAPVLLIPGTNLEPKANFDWNYEPALTAAGIPWCAVTLPTYGMNDIQVSAEYVVWAIRTMARESGRRVAVLGHSQGGLGTRWALRWWPDLRDDVSDVIMFGTPNHGATYSDSNYTGPSTCSASLYQMRSDSQFSWPR